MATRPSRTFFLPAAGTTAGNETIEISQGGAQVKATLSTNFAFAAGVLDIVTTPITGLNSVGTVGGLALTDVDAVDRGGTDYQVTQAQRVTLFRATPAGDRVWTMQSSTGTNAGPTLTLTAADHDKELVILGTFAGTIAADNTITAGFRTFITNESSATQTLSGISELSGTPTVSAAKSVRVYYSNGALKAFISGATGTSATSYTTSASPASSVTIGSTVTLTFSPNGQWQAGETITPLTTGTLAGTFSTPTNGAFSGGVLTPTVGNGLASTIRWTPNAGTSGTSGTFNSTPANLTNTTGAVNYAVTASTATAYTTSLNRSSGVVSQAVTATFTPNANWPAGEALSLVLTNLSGAWSNASGGTLGGSLLTPSAGSASVSADFTPSSANVGSISATTSPALTDTSGTQSYTAIAAATNFTTSPTSTTVASAAPSGNITFATGGGAWPVSSAITLALVTVAGTPNAVSGCSISGSGSSWTVTPTIGTTTNAVITFTPSSSNGVSGSITVGGTNITATNTSISVTVQSTIPSFPTLPGTGINSKTITVKARWKADAGITGTSSVTAVADQSGNSVNLAPTVGVSVGANTGSFNLPSLAFAGTSQASNSGLRLSGINGTTGFLTTAFNTDANWTFYVAFKTGTTLNVDEMVFSTAAGGTGVHLLWIDGATSHLKYQDRGCTSYTTLDLGAVTANTLYRFAARSHYLNPGDTPLTEDVWLNGTKTQYMQPGSAFWSGMTEIDMGQGFTGWAGWGMQHHLWLEAGVIQGALPDANVAGAGSIDNYLSSKWT